jgi:TonB family protein
VTLAGQLGSRFFPAPQWTTRLMQSRAAGTVIMLITVDNGGNITNIDVVQSTGFRELDEHTVNHVRRRFTFAVGQGVVHYELPIQWDNPLVKQ